MKTKLILPIGILLTVLLFFMSDIFEQEKNTAVALEPPISASSAIESEPLPVKPKVKTVYITETGECYHTANCACLKYSCIEIDLDDAQKSYRPCQNCHPDRDKKTAKP